MSLSAPANFVSRPRAMPAQVGNAPCLQACFVPYLDENPYQRMLAARLRTCGIEVEVNWSLASLAEAILCRRPSPDLVHLHWLPRVERNREGIGRLLAFVARLLIVRWSGRRIIWTAHNLYHHECVWPGGERWLTRRVIAASTRVITHSPSARERLIAEFRVKDEGKVLVIPHGHFLECYPRTMTRADARARLGLPQGAQVLLFFGQIRRYKGLPELLAAFCQQPGENLRLVVAGSVKDTESASALDQAASLDHRLVVRPGFVPESEVEVYFAGCDAVVFPYRDILTSGAVILAMSFGRACIAPGLEAIGDTLDVEGALLYDPSQPAALQQALHTAAANPDRLRAMGDYNRERVKSWDWEGIARRTATIYDAVTRAREPES